MPSATSSSLLYGTPISARLGSHVRLLLVLFLVVFANLFVGDQLAQAEEPSISATKTVGTLHLKDGRKLTGELTSLSIYQLNWTVPTGQTLSFPLSMVQKVDVQPVNSSTSQPAPLSATPPETTSPLTPPELIFPAPPTDGLIKPTGPSSLLGEPQALDLDSVELGGEIVAETQAALSEEGIAVEDAESEQAETDDEALKNPPAMKKTPNRKKRCSN
ncbi:MAG: hypothetical protein R3C11_21355 [Planctomycetaceae bacterium]